MSFITSYSNEKEHLIDTLFSYHQYKMPDGRQFYEATVQELKQFLNSRITTFCDDHTTSC
ncbi:hypothetical protein [Alkalihalobacterium chitinilyticum]|uniref:Fur-regulated basic protein FbpA n=1 Tax=Alkalihalobacterium chitinilyticum TaxID=2980103 RepID=A0ABT5VHA3_9BACI|nr:hypothetical protein [Alkalihalobacterium chitinilyticum]MDE5414820.1 hypothetical protein [Alkalihalobacterium chitinilyticum]